jgi:hypothetical protein
MSSARADRLLRDWRERFRGDPLARGVVAGLAGRSDEIWQGTFELLRRESPEYRNSVDDDFTKESKSHCNELLQTIIAVASGRAESGRGDAFDFVRSHAQWRAQHQVPLIASLHAYRLAHRTYWGITREALLRQPKQQDALVSLTTLSDFWIELFDHVGAVLAEAHAVEEGLIVAQSTRAYVGLVDDLLRGVAPREAEAQRLCALCGIKPGAPLAVAVARPLQARDGNQVDHEATLRSFVRLLQQALPSADFGKLVDLRRGEVVAVVCSDIDASRRLATALRRHRFARRGANGVAVGVGISLDAADVAGLPAALEEARLALDFAAAAQPLVPFAEIDLPEFLIRRADTAALRLVPDWARHFAPSEDGHGHALSRTVHTFADCNFNVKQTAKRLGIHTNTVYFRLNRINKLTGVDPRTFSGTSRLLTALRLLEIHGAGRPNP